MCWFSHLTFLMNSLIVMNRWSEWLLWVSFNYTVQLAYSYSLSGSSQLVYSGVVTSSSSELLKLPITCIFPIIRPLCAMPSLVGFLLSAELGSKCCCGNGLRRGDVGLMWLAALSTENDLWPPDPTSPWGRFWRRPERERLSHMWRSSHHEHKGGCRLLSHLCASKLGAPAQRLPGIRRCGVAGGGPCPLEPASSWSPHSVAASLGNEQGWGHYGNEPETPPRAAVAAHGQPEPGPGGGPSPG